MRRVVKLALLLAIILGSSAPVFAQTHHSFHDVFVCISMARDHNAGTPEVSDQGLLWFQADGTFLQTWGSQTVLEEGSWYPGFDLGDMGETFDAVVLADPEVRHSDIEGTYIDFPGFPFWEGRFIIGDVYDDTVGEYVLLLAVPYEDVYGVYPF